MSNDELDDEADARLSQLLKKLAVKTSPDDAAFECTELLAKLRQIPDLAQRTGEETAIHSPSQPGSKLGQ